MSDQDRIVTTLEQAAQSTADITEDCYERFYQRCPAARQLMAHVDPHMQGRMLQEVLELLMTPPDELNPRLLRFEVTNHRGYGVAAEQYRPLFEAVRDTVRATLGKAWSHNDSHAWDSRIEALDNRIQALQQASTA